MPLEKQKIGGKGDEKYDSFKKITLAEILEDIEIDHNGSSFNKPLTQNDQARPAQFSQIDSCGEIKGYA